MLLLLWKTKYNFKHLLKPTSALAQSVEHLRANSPAETFALIFSDVVLYVVCRSYYVKITWRVEAFIIFFFYFSKSRKTTLDFPCNVKNFLVKLNDSTIFAVFIAEKHDNEVHRAVLKN